MSSRIVILVTVLAGCASLAKLGLVAQKVEQRVPRPTPGNVAGVQIVIDTFEHIVREDDVLGVLDPAAQAARKAA